jgi:DNA-binding GntR family transcriptional regulator
MRDGLDDPCCVAFFDALVEGRLTLGQTITQEELGGILGFTLSRIRDVTVLLEAEGLIEVRKRLGLTIFYPDVQFVGGTFQFREILECEGLRRFAEMVPEDWIRRITDAHHEMVDFVKANPDPSVYAGPVKRLEWSFHGSFIDVLGNDQITINYRRNAQKMYLLRLLNPDAVGPSNTVKSLREHLAVVDALQVHDSDAAVEALQRHLKNVLHRVLTH